MLEKSYKKLCPALRAFAKDTSGVTAIEYAVIAVAVVGIVATVFGSDDGALQTVLSGLVSTIESLTSGTP